MRPLMISNYCRKSKTGSQRESYDSERNARKQKKTELVTFPKPSVDNKQPLRLFKAMLFEVLQTQSRIFGQGRPSNSMNPRSSYCHIIRKLVKANFGILFPVFSLNTTCLLYTSPSPRDGLLSRMPSSA